MEFVPRGPSEAELAAGVTKKSQPWERFCDFSKALKFGPGMKKGFILSWMGNVPLYLHRLGGSRVPITSGAELGLWRGDSIARLLPHLGSLH